MFTTWLAPFNKPNSSWRVKDPLGGASNLEMKDAFLLFHVSFLLMQTRLTHLKNKWFGPSYKLQRHILPVQCYCVVTVVTKVNFSKKVLSVLRSQQHRWHIGFFRDLCQHFHLTRHQTCCKTLLSELGLSSVSQNGSAGPFFFFFSTTQLTLGLFPVQLSNALHRQQHGHTPTRQLSLGKRYAVTLFNL